MLSRIELINRITKRVQQNFPSFGGGVRRGNWFNPIEDALKDKPAMFATGVDIASVVEFILKEIESYGKDEEDTKTETTTPRNKRRRKRAADV